MAQTESLVAPEMTSISAAITARSANLAATVAWGLIEANVVWEIEAQLELTLVEPLQPDYAASVSAARERLVSEQRRDSRRLRSLLLRASLVLGATDRDARVRYSTPRPPRTLTEIDQAALPKVTSMAGKR
jgi:hypothetical protein